MFEFSAGSPALWLVDTIGDREGAVVERLGGPRDFARWLGEAALVPADGSGVTEGDLVDARALRDATYCSALAVSMAQRPDAASIEVINRLSSEMPPRPQWSSDRIVQISQAPVRAALSALAADAITILADAQRGRVRLCPECRMMFVDRSPGGKRRWCSSVSACGNRAKVREHRARRSSSERKTI